MSFIAFAIVLPVAILTSCGKKGENDFKKGKAAYAIQDYKTAAMQFALAAEEGHDEAQYYVGVCFMEGNGVEKDLEEAVKWFRLAAEKGNVSAMYNLGMCYGKGDGVKKDMEEAVKWLHKAAKKGNTDAEFAIGTCYYSGNGVEKDLKEAVKWFRLAAEEGHTTALYGLGECYFSGDDHLQKDIKKAFDLWCEAAKKGNKYAISKLKEIATDSSNKEAHELAKDALKKLEQEQ